MHASIRRSICLWQACASEFIYKSLSMFVCFNLKDLVTPDSQDVPLLTEQPPCWCWDPRSQLSYCLSFSSLAFSMVRLLVQLVLLPQSHAVASYWRVASSNSHLSFSRSTSLAPFCWGSEESTTDEAVGLLSASHWGPPDLVTALLSASLPNNKTVYSPMCGGQVCIGFGLK